MRLVESLAFLSAHDQSFALAMGVDYSPLVSKAIGDILQLLLQSIGSSRPGYMCVVAQAMVGTMYHQVSLVRQTNSSTLSKPTTCAPLSTVSLLQANSRSLTLPE